MSEDTIAAAWINATLDGDPTLTGLCPGGVYNGEAEKDAAYPLVEFSPQSPGVTIKGVSTTIIGLNMLWLIKGVVLGKSYVPIEPVQNRIDALLHGVTSLTVPGGIIMSCVREQAFRLEPVQGGQDYRYLGGIYRILAQTN